MVTGEVTHPIHPIHPIVEFPNVVMNHIFNDIQHDEDHERKHEYMNRSRFKVFLKYQSKHLRVYVRV